MEQVIPGVNFGLSFIIGWLVKISLFLIVLLAMVTVRQVSLMNKVVNFPVGGGIRLLAWGFLLISLVLTAIVVLAS